MPVSDTGTLSERDGDLPVYRSSLPPASALLPYLERLDSSHRYSNRGELVCELETRLKTELSLGSCYAVTAATGTAALQAAILAVAGRAKHDRPLALIPGYTFVATAFAAEACGYEIVFVDVEPETMALSAERLTREFPLERVGLVVPVAPYGMVHSQSEWADFSDQTDIPVVIDCAASFETIRRDLGDLVGTVPVILSFHATKSFSTGEGGAVLWSDMGGLARVVQALNFGFLGSREARSAGFNGKLSEYHAAVGLASLDILSKRDDDQTALTSRYLQIAAQTGIASRLLLAPVISSNYALWITDSVEEAAAAEAAFLRAGIGHRRWYGKGTHLEPYFRSNHRPALPSTESLAARVIGIPIFEAISDLDIQRVIHALAEGCSSVNAHAVPISGR
jgi:dTDP-4-amino-4,6-dideoxygalactose transaminase